MIGGLVAAENWGDNNDNTLISPVGSLYTNLHGLGGNDTYIFYDNWGTDHVFDTAGNDTLDFVNVTSDQNLTFSFASGPPPSATAMVTRSSPTVILELHRRRRQ